MLYINKGKTFYFYDFITHHDNEQSTIVKENIMTIMSRLSFPYLKNYAYFSPNAHLNNQVFAIMLPNCIRTESSGHYKQLKTEEDERKITQT